MPRPDAICEFCGKGFLGRTDRLQRFCSTKCWGNSKTNDPAFILKRHSKATSSGCVVWVGYTVKGYGRFTVKRKPVLAHRAAYELAYGKVREGLFVCHRCDNPVCINPKHLFAGTAADNSADMVKKSRQMAGERHYKATLTAKDVRAILASNLSNRELGRAYGVNHSHISSIKTRKIWKQI